MKALTTPSGNFGPFTSIEVLEDRYHCDNTDLPFTVVGTGDIVEADTITWPAPPEPPIDVAKVQADLLALDLKSIRALREYVAAQADAPKFIKDHETKAVELRKKL